MTHDKIKYTVDYSLVHKYIIHKIKLLQKVKLLEYLAEQLLNSLGQHFKKIVAARITIEKGYVPLEFSGTVKIEAYKEYRLKV